MATPTAPRPSLRRRLGAWLAAATAALALPAATLLLVLASYTGSPLTPPPPPAEALSYPCTTATFSSAGTVYTSIWYKNLTAYTLTATVLYGVSGGGSRCDSALVSRPYTVAATSGVCIDSGTQIQATGIGSCTVTKSVAAYSRACPIDATNTCLYPGVSTTDVWSGIKRDKDVGWNAVLPNGTVGGSDVLSAFVIDAQTGGSTTGYGGASITYSSGTTSVCTVSGSTVTYIAAGTCSLSAYSPVSTYYNASTAVSDSVTVSKATQTVSFTSITAGSVGNTRTLSASSDSGLTSFSYSSTTTGVCTVSGTTVTYIAAGTCSVTATQAGNSIYLSDSATDTGTVSQVAQTISFTPNPIPDRSADSGSFQVSVTASSGLAVTVASSTTAVCTISGSTVTLVLPTTFAGAAGTCTLTATQAGNTMYSAAPTVSRSFLVTKITQTITFDALADATYGDAPLTATATASSGLSVTLTSSTPAVCTVAGSTVTIVGAGDPSGTCTLTASQAGNSTYAAAADVIRSFTVSRKAQTISCAPSGKTFGDAPFDRGCTTDSGLGLAYTSNSTDVCTVAGSTVTIVAAGDCLLTVAQAGSSNWLPGSISGASVSTAVAKASQTITFAAIADKAVSDPAFSVTATSSSGIAVTVTSSTAPVCTISGTRVTLVAAGLCTLSAVQGGSSNFEAATTVTRSFAVGPLTTTIGRSDGQPTPTSSTLISCTVSFNGPVSVGSAATALSPSDFIVAGSSSGWAVSLLSPASGTATTVTVIVEASSPTPGTVVVSLPAGSVDPGIANAAPPSTCSVTYDVFDRGTVTLLREKAAYSSSDGVAPGACGSTWSPDGTSTGSALPPVSESMADGVAACYRWTVIAADYVGNTTTSTSSPLPVDPTVSGLLPISASAGALVDGTTVYYRGADGGLTLYGSPTDDESGIASVTFSDLRLGGGVTGALPGGAIPLTDDAADASGRFAAALSANSSTARTTEIDLSALNGAGGTVATVTATLRRDDDAPAVTWTDPAAAYRSTEIDVPLQFGVSDGSGAGLDLTALTLRRDRSTTVAASIAACASAAWTTDAAAAATTTAVDTVVVGLANTFCYRWVVAAADLVGNTTTATSPAVWVQVDTTAPVWGTTTLSGSCPAVLSGTDIFFRPGSACSITLAQEASDPETGVASITFGGAGNGWTPTTTASIAGSPASRTYSAAANAGSTTVALVAANGVGLTTEPRPIDIYTDTAGPTADFSAPAAGTTYTNVTETTVSWTESDTRDGALPGSGNASRTVAVERAPAAAEATCPASGYSTVASGLAPVSGTDITLDLAAVDTGSVDGTCYRFIVSATDTVGNTAATTSSPLMVDLTAPGGTLAIDGNVTEAASSTVDLVTSASDAASGVVSIRYASDGGYSWSASPWLDYSTHRTRSIGLSGGSGIYYIAVQVKDRAGNISTLTRTVSIVAGVTPPTIGAGAYIYDCETGERIAVNDTGTIVYSVDQKLCFIPIAREIAAGTDTSGATAKTGHITKVVASYQIDANPYTGADAARAQVVAWPATSGAVAVPNALIGATPLRFATAGEYAAFRAARESTASASSFPYLVITYKVAVEITWSGGGVTTVETAYPTLELVLILKNSGTIGGN